MCVSLECYLGHVNRKVVEYMLVERFWGFLVHNLPVNGPILVALAEAFPNR